MKPSVWLVMFVAAMMLTVGTYALGAPNPLKGKRLYRSYCLVCHGTDGRGTGPLAKKRSFKPADLTSDRYKSKDIKGLAAIIEGYGRGGGSNMPNWGEALPKSDLQDLAAYLIDVNVKGVSYLGDARRGRVIFKGACIACHGEFGSGNGVLANLINIPMVNQTDADRMEEISDEELIGIIRDGTGHYMAAWKGTLTESEITDVATYVRLLPAIATEKSVQYIPNPLEGRRLYRSYCLVCHGVDGKSIGPLAHKLDLKPADLSAEKYQTKSIEILAAIIEGYGRNAESNMPSWGTALLNTDLRDIAAYLTKLTLKDLSYQGDERRGRAIFKGACVACHGRFGTGKGILAQLIKIPMLDFTDKRKMDQISDEELINAIREGKGEFMASWKEAFNAQEIIDAAAYVRSLSR